MSSSSTSSFSPPDHHQTLVHSSSSHQLCYVHCNFCDTVLAVSVPSCSLFKTVTVRCGHCSNLLSVNMGALLVPPQPSSNHQYHPIHNPPPSLHQEELYVVNTVMNNSAAAESEQEREQEHHRKPTMMQIQQPKRVDEMLNTFSKQKTSLFASINKPPEKRQRVPSVYNRFIREEIQRIKAGNPDITHRQAFSAAAKNWAYFPHIHFGLMPEELHQPVTKKPNLLSR
uniref:Uncharacterized protein n=2 Tax=Kalanchoe fedtschenkoi TaxID=63787 RepID=A0A7N0TE16_KALFE